MRENITATERKDEKITAGIEDYLEAILSLTGECELCRSVDIAKRLNVSKPAVHKATHVLKDLNFIEQKRYGGIAMTESGKKAAEDVAARHEAIKKFLVTILGVSEETAEADACVMEHQMSRETLKKIIKYKNR